jgi:hypothetical protein
MAIFTLTDALILAHDQDLSGQSNKTSLKVSVAELDASVFGTQGWQGVAGGLKSVAISADGFLEPTAVLDAALWASLGVADRAWTVAAANVAAQPAFLAQAGEFDYTTYDAVGTLMPFTIGAKGTNKNGVVRGQLAKAKGSVAATGALGSGVNLGAGGAGKSLYATLHAFTAGTTVTVIIQSDTTSGFGAPTTRATIGPITAVGGTFMVPVPITAVTDTWWRMNVSAITGTFTLAGALAIL